MFGTESHICDQQRACPVSHQQLQECNSRVPAWELHVVFWWLCVGLGACTSGVRDRNGKIMQMALVYDSENILSLATVPMVTMPAYSIPG